MCVAVVAIALLASCKSEARKQHEVLAITLREPVNAMCNTFHMVDAGGCNAYCWGRVFTLDAQTSIAASRTLAALPPFADAATEAKLAAVRAAANALVVALDPPCGALRPARYTQDPAVLTCLDAVQKSQVAKALHDAIGALAQDVKARTGATLPSDATCPKPVDE